MARYRVKYRRGNGDDVFEEIVEVSAPTKNQAIMRIRENIQNYKMLSFKDVEIIGVDRVESWED